jgi:hypothetical protein
MTFAFLSRLTNLRRERTRCPTVCRPTLEALEERCVPTGWGFSLGTPNVNDWGTAVAVDTAGRSYVSGYISAPADVDPGPNTVNASGTFIARYNPDGSLDSTFGTGGVVSLSNLSNAAFARGVVVGTDGSVAVVGRFNQSVDFDPQHSYADNRDIRNAGSGSGDFLWKMDASGNFQWVRSYAGNDSIRVAIDGGNNLYLTGSSGPNDFDPDNVWADRRDTPVGYGGADPYVAKFDPSGVLQWVRSAGGAGDDAGHGIAVRSDGMVYVTGTVAAPPATFGSLTLASGSNIGVVARLDTNGNLDRLYQAGGTDVALDASGNVFAASFSGQSITKLDGDLSAVLWTQVISSPNRMALT